MMLCFVDYYFTFFLFVHILFIVLIKFLCYDTLGYFPHDFIMYEHFGNFKILVFNYIFIALIKIRINSTFL